MGNEPNQRDTRFLRHIHGFRGIAIIAVVSTHVAEALEWHGSLPLSARAIQVVTRNSTIPFVFVAGFLFQHLSARFRYRTYLLTKLKNVIVPYLICSLPTLANQFFRHVETYAELPPGQPMRALAITLQALLTGSHMPTPLWFIPVVALFYLAAPVFIAVDRRPTSYWAIPFLVLIATFMHRPLLHARVWQSAVYCLPAYLLGCWASHYRDPLLDWLSRHRRWMGLAFGALVLVELFVLQRSGPIFSAAPFSTERGIVDVDLAAKLIASLAILELLRATESKLPNWLLAVASASFGIYFIHQYVIKLIEAIARRSSYSIVHRGVVTFFVLWIVVTVASYLLVRLTQRVFGKHSRWLIGS